MKNENPITPADLEAARDLTRAQRDLELSLLVTEARIALDAVDPLWDVLPEPARDAVRALAKFVRKASS